MITCTVENVWFVLHELCHNCICLFEFKLMLPLYSDRQFLLYSFIYSILLRFILFCLFRLLSCLGYGDIFPETVPAKILTSIIVLLGFSLIPAQVSGERNDVVMEDEEIRESGERYDIKEYDNMIASSKVKSKQIKTNNIT